MKLETKVGKDYKQQVSINASTKLVFQAIAEDLGKWWGDMDKPVQNQGDVFTVSWGEPWYQFEVVEYEPFKKITWSCIDANQIIDGLEGVEKEWVGTQVVWELVEEGNGTVKVSMAHQGLIPNFTCFDVCSSAWDHFITGSLKSYLER